jgi:hypothetical protein
MSLLSLLNTAYRDLKGALKYLNIRVLTRFSLSDRVLTIEIERSSPEIDFALGSLERVAPPTRIKDTIDKAPNLQNIASNIGFVRADQLIKKEELDWLGSARARETLLLFRVAKSDQRVIRIAIPIEFDSVNAYSTTTGSLFAFEPDGRLVGVGQYSLVALNP